MRILLLKRQAIGGISTYAKALAGELAACGEDVSLVDSTSWIPDQTGKPHDKPISRRLFELAKPFDLVHAFGYRCAWACAEAFRKRRPWIYTAYDLPKTTHPALIERLTLARAGLCSSNAVYRALDSEFLPRLRLVRPGIASDELDADKGAARVQLGVDPSVPLVSAIGRAGPRSGFDALAASAERLRARVPGAEIVIAGEGSVGELGEGVRHLGVVDGAMRVMAASDLVVVPSRSKGFSMVALEAMVLGRPVLLRDSGGLGELVDERVSGLTFDSDESLGDQIASALQMPLMLKVLGDEGRARVRSAFSLKSSTEAVRRAYLEAL